MELSELHNCNAKHKFNVDKSNKALNVLFTKQLYFH